MGEQFSVNKVGVAERRQLSCVEEKPVKWNFKGNSLRWTCRTFFREAYFFSSRICLSPCLSVCFPPSVSMFISTYLPTFQDTYLPPYFPIYVSVYPPIYRMHLSIFPPTHISVYVYIVNNNRTHVPTSSSLSSIQTLIFPPIHSFISQSIHPSVPLLNHLIVPSIGLSLALSLSVSLPQRARHSSIGNGTHHLPAQPTKLESYK